MFPVDEIASTNGHIGVFACERCHTTKRLLVLAPLSAEVTELGIAARNPALGLKWKKYANSYQAFVHIDMVFNPVWRPEVVHEKLA